MRGALPGGAIAVVVVSGFSKATHVRATTISGSWTTTRAACRRNNKLLLNLGAEFPGYFEDVVGYGPCKETAIGPCS